MTFATTIKASSVSSFKHSWKHGREQANDSVKKKVCVKGESNPQLNLGRVPCYHYTIDALRLLADVKIDIYIP